jgi:ankyrin repeat protein
LLAAAILQDNAKGLADFIVRTGTDVNFAFGRSRRSLLHVAAGVGAVECLHVLAKRGANIETRDRFSDERLFYLINIILKHPQSIRLFRVSDDDF